MTVIKFYCNLGNNTYCYFITIEVFGFEVYTEYCSFTILTAK